MIYYGPKVKLSHGRGHHFSFQSQNELKNDGRPHCSTMGQCIRTASQTITREGRQSSHRFAGSGNVRFARAECRHLINPPWRKTWRQCGGRTATMLHPYLSSAIWWRATELAPASFARNTTRIYIVRLQGSANDKNAIKTGRPHRKEKGLNVFYKDCRVNNPLR